MAQHCKDGAVPALPRQTGAQAGAEGCEAAAMFRGRNAGGKTCGKIADFARVTSV